MRLVRADLIPVLAILVGGTVGGIASGLVFSSPSTSLPPVAVDVAAPPSYTVPPRILNIEEVRRAMFASFPEGVRDGEVGGTATISFFIDERGEVRETRIDVTSGHEPVDQAALSVASVFRFSPALSGATPVRTWFSHDMTFDMR